MPLSNQDKPLCDVEDTKAALGNLAKVQTALRHRLMDLAFEHTNKVLGHLGNKDMYLLRDMAIYRAESIQYHVLLLLRTYNQGVANLENSPTDSEGPTNFVVMELSSKQQFAVFDSIVFHCISLFDYLGNLVALCAQNSQRKRNWNSVANAARHDENSLSTSPVAPVIQRLDREWVDRLYSHRSDLIHSRADLGGRTVTRYVSQEDSGAELRVFAPMRFVKNFQELYELSETHRITLRYVGFWCAERTAKSAIEVVNGLRKHIEQNRAVPEGDEPIQPPTPDENAS